MELIEEVEGIDDAYDLVIVGAGAAGLAAATKAGELGLKVLVADENPGPGGQIYRGITTTPVKNRKLLGDAYWEGLALVHAFTTSPCQYSPQTTVWSVDAARDDVGDIAIPNTFDVGISKFGKAKIVRATRIILATGALERPFAMKGWTLPGVMTAGAVQIALKSSGIIPAGRTAIVGSGPLLLLLADQLKRAGADIVAVLNTTATGNLRRALPQLIDFLLSPYSIYGLKLFAKSRFSLPVINGVSNPEIGGTAKAESISYVKDGKTHTVACDHVLLHQGVIPNINMSNAIGCAHKWDAEMHAWVPTVDSHFESSIPGVGIVGDGAGIAGALSAGVRGRIAAIAAASALGRVDSGVAKRAFEPLLAEARRLNRGRGFINALYRPANETLRPRDPKTIVCRCEEVRVGQIRETIQKLHVLGPNQLKAYLRTGMGPCQGRMCGPTVIELIAEERGVPVEDVGYFRLRMPVKPITLQEIASVPQSTASKNAVMR